MNIEAVIAKLGTTFDADVAAFAERMLREYNGTIADAQLMKGVGRAVAVHRWVPAPGFLIS